ncbi:MAG: hypothetical protein PW792_12850 [Acidobacteriaceae bacterium]|nr:hypothetical protein [Acidobacteriaceae bacterium]
MNNLLHLTDEQIDEHLIGDLAPAAASHLAGCEHCQERVAATEAPMVAFREMSLAWAERRSATMPVPAMNSHTTRASHRFGWAMAGTCALALGFAIPVTRAHHAPAETAAVAVVAPVAAPAVVATPAPVEATVAAVSHTGMTAMTPVGASAEQIERDNRMLQAIDRELGAPDATLAAYAMEPQSSETRASHSNTVRD